MTQHSDFLTLPNPGRRTTMIGLLGAAGSLAFGMPGAWAATPPRRGGRIRVANNNSSVADSLDPAKGSHTGDYVRHSMFYSGLTEFDAKMRVQMALAAEITSTDNIVWLIKLRPGVTFHNGKSLDAQDVVFSLMRHKDPKTASKVKTLVEDLTQVEAVDAATVRVTLSGANVDFPAVLAVPHLLIVAKGTEDFSKGNGTGPFVCEVFEPGTRCIGKRNPNFWKSGKPYLDEVEVLGIADDAARLNALLAGDLQIISPVPARDVERIKNHPRVAILESDSSLYSGLILRQDMVPTNNPDFVQAVKYLQNRERIRDVLLKGYGTIANDHPVPSWHPYFLKDLPQRTYDLDRAKFHVKKGGLTGVAAEIVTSPAIESALDSAQLLQQSAAQAGMKLSVRRVPHDGYWSTHWFKHPMTYGSTLPRPTLDLLFNQFYRSDAPWNETGWKSEQFDQLLVASRKEADEAKRREIYGDMQTLIYEKGSIVIPTFLSFIDAYDRRVQGLEATPAGRMMGYQFAESVWLAS